MGWAKTKDLEKPAVNEQKQEGFSDTQVLNMVLRKCKLLLNEESTEVLGEGKNSREVFRVQKKNQ